MEKPPKNLFIPAPVPDPLLEAARSLRKNMTDAERLLWFCLRRRQLGGFRFRRQHPFEQFVLDFYCMQARLAVELDGGQHNMPEMHVRDKERTAFLECHGIQVVRFWNSEVFNNLEGVLQIIYDSLQRRLVRNADGIPLPDPPPLGISADLSKKTSIFSPSPSGGGLGRGRKQYEISASYQSQPCPHPNLPPPGEGTKSLKLAHMPPLGEGEE